MNKKIGSKTSFGIFSSVVLLVLIIATVITTTNVKSPQTINSQAKNRGDCYVAPSTVSAGQDYTIYGSGFNQNESLIILISDLKISNTWNLKADSKGSTTLTWHSNLKGTNTVTFNPAVGQKSSALATCTFEVN